MATSLSKSICGVCQQQDLNKSADFWCPQCDEGLCYACKKVHEFSKASKHHKVLSIEDYEKLPNDFQAGKPRCVDHELLLDLYCKKHEQPCCSGCLKERHADCGCNEIDSFDNVVKNIKCSAKFELIEKCVVEVKSDLDTLSSYYSETIADVRQQMLACRNEMKAARKRLNDHLDKLEKKLENAMRSDEKKLVGKCEDLKKISEHRQDTVKGLHDKLEKLKLYSTDHQTFFGLEIVEKGLLEHKTYIDTLSESGDLTTPIINIDIFNVIDQILELGNLTIERIPAKLDLNILKKDSAQLQVLPRRPISTETFLLKLKNKFSLENQVGGSLDAGVIKPSGDLLFVSYGTKQLLSCKCDGQDLREVAVFEDYPIDLAFVPELNYVVVGFNEEKETVRVDLKSGNKQGMGFNSHGVDFKNGYILSSIYSLKTVRRMKSESSGNESTTLDCTPDFIAGFNDVIICTAFEYDFVSCWDWNGKQKWRFQHKELVGPLGITTTDDGYSLIACQPSKNIWVLSPDGKDGRILLSEADGISEPRGIHFNCERKELLVINEETRNILLFEVDW